MGARLRFSSGKPRRAEEDSVIRKGYGESVCAEYKSRRKTLRDRRKKSKAWKGRGKKMGSVYLKRETIASGFLGTE